MPTFRVPPEYQWMRMGESAFYHPIIGQPANVACEIRCEPWLLSGHTWVAMVTGKSGCVACEALESRETVLYEYGQACLANSCSNQPRPQTEILRDFTAWYPSLAQKLTLLDEEIRLDDLKDTEPSFEATLPADPDDERTCWGEG